jgi:hypothetical protein
VHLLDASHDNDAESRTNRAQPYKLTSLDPEFPIEPNKLPKLRLTTQGFPSKGHSESENWSRHFIKQLQNNNTLHLEVINSNSHSNTLFELAVLEEL